MTPDIVSIPLKSRRQIEGELAGRIYRSACSLVGETRALAILDAAIDEAAFEAGRAFAAGAPPEGPSLGHFSQVVRLWQAGGALDIDDIRRADDSLSFRVTRCGYMDLYRDLGLPAVLHSTLSCRRDAAFARGYSPCLAMERPQTLSGGAPACLFRFQWRS